MPDIFGSKTHTNIEGDKRRVLYLKVVFILGGSYGLV